MHKFIPIILTSVVFLACPGSERTDSPSDGGGMDSFVLTAACGEILHCSQANNCAESENVPSCVEMCAVEFAGQHIETWTAYSQCFTENCSHCDLDDEDCFGGCAFINCTQEWYDCAIHMTSGTADCAETFACNDACPDDEDGCLQGCIENASTEAQTTFFSVVDCWANSIFGTGVDCGDVVVACACSQFDDVQGTGECRDFLDCTDQCEGNICCFPECRSELSAEAQTQSDELMDCITGNCSHCSDGDDDCWGACIGQSCFDPFMSCQCPDAANPGSGSADCLSTFECIVGGCGGQGGECCNASCVGNASSEAYGQLIAFFDCIDGCGCGEGDDFCWMQCMTQECRVVREDCGINLGGPGGP